MSVIMSPWLFNVCVVTEVNDRMLERGLELMGANGVTFEITAFVYR